MRKRTENFVAETELQFAMRETQAMIRRPGVRVVLLAIGLVLGLAGPFDTQDAMRLLPRLAYWIAVTVITFLTGSFVGELLGRHLLKRKVPRQGVVVLIGLGIGVTVFLEIMALNWALFGLSPATPGYAWPLAGNALLVSVIVAWVLDYLGTDQPEAVAEAWPPALLARLSLEKRGPLMALSVSDHYVEVRTRAGCELVLMRLSDAIGETQPEPGLQVHRSHWVALKAVKSAHREGARAILTLTDGHNIPVSRTYLTAVKDAGLLAE